MKEKDIKNQLDEEKNTEVVENTAPQEEIKEEPKVDDKPYFEVIEDKRKAFFHSYVVNRRIGNILMFVTVAVAVGVMLMVTADQVPYLPIIGWIIAGVALLGMVVYFFINKKKQPEKGQNYISSVVKIMNDKAFEDKDFSDLVFDEKQKLELQDLVGDGVYKDASQIRSRNVVRGIYNGHHFLYGEAALMRQQVNRKQQTPPLFVGKYISMPNDLDFNGRFIVVNKNPKEPLDVPNDIEDLEVLEEKESFVIYGPKDSSIHKYVRKEILTMLENIAIDAHLLNVNVVFWKGHSAAYLSYDDASMSVPFDKPFDKNTFEQSVRDVMVCFKSLLGK